MIAVTFLTTCETSCLKESETTVGLEGETTFSHFEEIETIGADDYSFQSFRTCEDQNGNLTGTQYILSDVNGNIVELSAMGEMVGNCRPLTLSGQVEKIAATYSTRTNSVSGIRYMREPD